MPFNDAQSYLDALGIDAMKDLKPSLHRIEAICEAIDHPERAVPAIHITGTNGKTSTARIATSLLTASGLDVGTYTSPHLEIVRERVARAGEPISTEEFGEAFDHLFPYVRDVEKQLGESLSYFELLTAMFFLWAAEAPVDVMVVEVGLGGRWDATNVVPSQVAVVTNVGLDHTGLLGMEREVIAKEKAGIIKPGSLAVTGEIRPSVLDVIAAESAGVGAPLAILGRDFEVLDNQVAFGGRYLALRTSERIYTDLFMPLHGGHQVTNAAVALEAVVQFLPPNTLGEEVVAQGLAGVHTPGRLEALHPDDAGAPTIVLDVAHNPEGMAALISSLPDAFAFESVVFVVGILGDKDYEGMISELARLECTIIATEAASVRSVPPVELQRAALERGLDCEAIGAVDDAVRRAAQIAREGQIICITGSHYVVGEARSLLVGGV